MYFRGVPRWLSGTRPFAKWLVESFLLLLVTDSIANCFSFRLIDPKRWKPAAYVRRVVSGYLGVYGNEIPFLWFLRARAMLLKYRWADFETVHMNRIIVRVEIFKYAVEFVSCIRLHRLTTQSSVTMFRSNRLEFPQVVPILSSILSLLHFEPYLNSPSSTDGLIFHFLDLLMFLNLFPECFDSVRECVYIESRMRGFDWCGLKTSGSLCMTTNSRVDQREM